MKTPEEYLSRGTGNFINCTDYDDAIQAMQEYAQTISEPLKKLLKHHADMLAESDTQNLKYAQKIVNLEAISEGKDREIEELRKKNHKYRVALDTISDPIAHLHSKALFSGGQVDGSNAVYLSNSADYLKNIAREAIK